MFTLADHRHMARALDLARQGLYTTAPNPRVGCVLVRDGRVVGEGTHRRAGQPHAEVGALDSAGEHARGATAYVTLEPCRHTGRTPPCTGALISAGVTRVVAAMTDPDPRVSGAGLAELDAAGVSTACGLMHEQARALNEGFVSRMGRGRPFVRVKLAMSLDGRTALASGESRWITGPSARRQVQHWRAQSGALITGIGTVLADDPGLDVRPAEMPPALSRLAEPVRQPLRVVMDSSFRLPPGCRLLEREGPVLVVGQREARDAAARLGDRVEIACLDAAGERPDPGALLSLLAAREVNDVLVEAGPTLAGAFVAAGLADELLVYTAPTFLGPDARALLALPGLEYMSQRLTMKVIQVCRVGADVLIRARPQP